MNGKRDYIGTGWAFPLQVNVRGGILLSSPARDVKEAIQIILRTELGERVYRPDFGCRLSELTFAPMNTRTLFLIRLYVQEALEIWEPRIDLEEVEVDPDPVAGKVDIIINYRLKDSYEPGSLVYPFYLMTSEG
jgi:phage baseplate assembly protein W